MGNVKWIQRPLSRIMRCTVAGTSGGAEPGWDRDPGDTTVDGSVTWICEEGSRTGIADWQALTVYGVGSYVRPTIEYGGLNYSAMMTKVDYDSYSECLRNSDGHIYIEAEPFYANWRYPHVDILMQKRPAWVTGTLCYIHFHMTYEATRLTTSYQMQVMGWLWYTNLKTPPTNSSLTYPVYVSGPTSGEIYWESNTKVPSGDPITWGTVDANTIGFHISVPRYGFSGWVKVIQEWLEIEFIPASAFVTTEAVDNILIDGGDGHGTICQIPEGNYTERGFEYYKDGEPENVLSVSENGDFGLESYSLSITGLSYPAKYYVRAYALNDKLTGYGDWVEFTTLNPPTVTNIGATNSSVFARTILTGEIGAGEAAVERGFEYKIQDAEPAAEDTGTEVKETYAGGFAIGEYSLKNKELYDQQYIADNIIWWFRAYCKDDGDNKYVADSWMKNMPTVTTQAMSSINYNKADGNGTISSIGASELTERGFEVKHEYYGSLPQSWKFEIAGFEGEVEGISIINDLNVVIDYKWQGDLVKTVLETAGLALGAYSITIGQMILGWPLADDCLIDGRAYKCKAFASNEFGTVYGEEVEFSTWTRTCLTAYAPTIGEGTIIKNEDLGCLPIGVTASRRGFRFGTTETADEFDVHEDGSFTNGPYSMMLPDLLPDTTYYIVAYIVVNGIFYEGEMEIITTDPEGTEDEDEYPTPHFSPHGQDYREMSTKVFAEVLASIGIIEFSGGKKTLPITNHLIQTNSNAKTIADSYLDRFKLAKTRMTVTFPTPLPFEREDTVDFSYGALLFKEDDEGVVYFKEDGAGVSVLLDQISMIIKKINSVGLAKTETSIDYTAVLDLEHE